MTIGKHWPIKPAAVCCRYCRVGPNVAKLTGLLPGRMLAWANGVNELPLAKEVELARIDLEAPVRMASHGPVTCVMAF